MTFSSGSSIINFMRSNTAPTGNLGACAQVGDFIVIMVNTRQWKLQLPSRILKDR